MNWILFAIPFISAFIGWFASRIAVKTLFHPKEPKNFAGMTFQGFFPKRQKEFAIKLGKLVSSELLSFSVIEQKISNPANVEKILPLLETHIDTFLKEKLIAEIPMIRMMLGEKTIALVKSVFLKELQELFPILMKQYMNTMKVELDLEKIVIEKISTFSIDKLEELLHQAIAPELRFAEIIGAVLGLMIGVIQIILTLIIT